MTIPKSVPFKVVVKYVALVLPAMILVNCDSEDDGGSPPPMNVTNIRLVTVDPVMDLYSLQNFGTETVNISSYQFCSQFQYTQNLNSLTVVEGQLNLSPGDKVTLTGWPIDDESADLAIYLPTTDFSDAEKMLDFVQWGGPGNGREPVAVAKGIWSTGDFIDGPGPFNYLGNGSQNGLDQWEIDPPATLGAIVRLSMVNPQSDIFSITNFGDEPLDISGYRLCSRFSYTADLSSLNLDQGSLVLQPGESVTVSGWPVEDDSADLGLYLPAGDFGDPDRMVDFVQWGEAGIGREPVAVQKGIWNAGGFVSGTGPFSYMGDGFQDGPDFWE